MGSGREQGPGRGPAESGASRRDFLRKTAIAGGALWVAPVVTRMSSAHAQGAGSPVPGICGSECVGTAYGAHLDLLGPQTFPASPGTPCPIGDCSPVDVGGGPPAPFSLRAGAACGCVGAVPNDVCTAEGSVANVALNVSQMLFPMATQDLTVQATVLKSRTTQDCETCDEAQRSSEIVGLVIGLPNGTNQAVAAAVAPNTVIVDSATTFPGLRIVVNEQGCTAAGNWYTAALTIRLPDATPTMGKRIILGYSEIRRSSCPDPCTTPPDTAEVVPLP